MHTQPRGKFSLLLSIVARATQLFFSLRTMLMVRESNVCLLLLKNVNSINQS